MVLQALPTGLVRIKLSSVFYRRKWFLLIENEVRGPFEEESLDSYLSRYPEVLVWGPGLAEWMSLTEWKKMILNLKEVWSTIQKDLSPIWYAQTSTQDEGPFSFPDLVFFIRNQIEPSAVKVRLENESDWKEISDFPDILNEIGISRRKHKRVPISGSFAYQKNDLQNQIPLVNISEGGFGVSEAYDLRVHDLLEGEILSPSLERTLKVHCRVLYKSDHFSWGLQFSVLRPEDRDVIAKYVLKFESAGSL